MACNESSIIASISVQSEGTGDRQDTPLGSSLAASGFQVNQCCLGTQRAGTAWATRPWSTSPWATPPWSTVRSDILGVPWHFCISESPASQKRAPCAYHRWTLPTAGKVFHLPGPHQGFPGSASVKRTCLPMQEMWVHSLGREDPLDEGMATHFSILAWRIPWTDEPIGSQRVRHDCSDLACTHMPYQMNQLWPPPSPQPGGFPPLLDPELFKPANHILPQGPRTPPLSCYYEPAPHGRAGSLCSPAHLPRSPAWPAGSSSGGSACV